MIQFVTFAALWVAFCLAWWVLSRLSPPLCPTCLAGMPDGYCRPCMRRAGQAPWFQRKEYGA